MIEVKKDQEFLNVCDALESAEMRLALNQSIESNKLLRSKNN
jgi:hypothetical protein